MQFSIDSHVLAKFPSAKIALVIGSNLKNKQSSTELQHLLTQACNLVRQQFTAETIPTTPKIQDWREAYRSFGLKPSEYRCSVEALLRRVVAGKELPSLSSIVDTYNIISVTHLVPVGAMDLDAIQGNINLVIANGTERFIMLGAIQPDPIKQGEVVYTDDRDVLCRGWNYRESEKSKIRPTSTHVCFVIEGLEHISKEEILQAAHALLDLAQRFCGGTYQIHYADAAHPIVSL